MKIIANGSNDIVLSASAYRPFNKKLIYRSDKSPKIPITNPLNYWSFMLKVLPSTYALYSLNNCYQIHFLNLENLSGPRSCAGFATGFGGSGLPSNSMI